MRIQTWFQPILLCISTLSFAFKQNALGLLCIGLSTMLFSRNVIQEIFVVESLELSLMSISLGLVIVGIAIVISTIAVVILR